MTRKLSPREKEIAKLLAKEYSYREIADELNLSRKAITSRVCRIYIKLGISGQPQPRKLIKDIYHLPT